MGFVSYRAKIILKALEKIKVGQGLHYSHAGME